jgi:hypothetical protein
LLVLSAASVSAKRRSVKQAPHGSLGGTVAAGTTPIANATVHVWRDEKEVASANTAANGEFHVSLEDGTYAVQASALHFHAASAVRITVVVHVDRETWVNLEMVSAP